MVSARRAHRASDRRSRSVRTWATLGVLLLALVYAFVDRYPDVVPGGVPSLHDQSIVQLYEEQRSGAVVEGDGTVERILPDDNDGSRHQRFILRLSSGHTLLVSHNIDLADRVANLEEGDQIAFRGQYEWNDRGGVVHWTHHDPAGRRPGGWLRHEGSTYR